MKNLGFLLRRFLSALIPARVEIPVRCTNERSSAVAHKVVRDLSRSNFNLKRGRYITSEQIEARKGKLAEHQF